MKKATYIIVTLTVTALLLAGCQESESAQLRRARLVGNENLKLKKQIAEKDEEIQALKDEIARIEKERALDQEEFGNSILNALQIAPSIQKQVETLTAENNALREQLKQLQK